MSTPNDLESKSAPAPTEKAALGQLENTQNEVYTAIDPEEEKRVVRKLYRTIMPLMAVVYFFQYLDKQAISQAVVFDLRTDLNLDGLQFSWVVSLSYLGQLVSEYPAAYLLSRLPVVRYVGFTVIVWGAVNCCLAAPHNFSGMAAARFFLGFTEAKGAEWGIVVSTWLAGTSASLFCASASILTSNVKGNTKKSVVSAAYFIFCLGSVVSPQAWTQDDVPRYTKGCILSISSLVCFMITLVVYAVMAKRENRHRDRMAAEGHVEYMGMSGNSGGGRCFSRLGSD